jgi:hypothetical protein
MSKVVLSGLTYRRTDRCVEAKPLFVILQTHLKIDLKDTRKEGTEFYLVKISLQTMPTLLIDALLAYQRGICYV